MLSPPSADPCVRVCLRGTQQQKRKEDDEGKRFFNLHSAFVWRPEASTRPSLAACDDMCMRGANIRYTCTHTHAHMHTCTHAHLESDLREAQCSAVLDHAAQPIKHALSDTRTYSTIPSLDDHILTLFGRSHVGGVDLNAHACRNRVDEQSIRNKDPGRETWSGWILGQQRHGPENVNQ